MKNSTNDPKSHHWEIFSNEFSEYHSRQLLTYTDRSINKNKFIILQGWVYQFKNKCILTSKKYEYTHF